MAEPRAEDLVRDWYGDIAHWAQSTKTSSCVDRYLLTAEDVVQKAVLNIGCFYPQDEIHYGGAASLWVAIDFCPEVIERCKQLPKMHKAVEFIEMDARNLEFPDASFDTVLDFSSGDQMDKDSYLKVLKEVVRVLKPGGSFIVTYSNNDYFQEAKGYTIGDCGYNQLYRPSEMKELLQSHGFIVAMEVQAKTLPRAGISVLKP